MTKRESGVVPSSTYVLLHERMGENEVLRLFISDLFLLKGLINQTQAPGFQVSEMYVFE